jgi:prophage regulatory protein
MVQNILREPAVLRAMGFSHFKLWNDIKKGTFPAPVKIGQRAVGWFADEIASHQEQLKAERDTRLAERGAK